MFGSRIFCLTEFSSEEIWLKQVLFREFGLEPFLLKELLPKETSFVNAVTCKFFFALTPQSGGPTVYKNAGEACVQAVADRASKFSRSASERQ